MQKPEVNFRLSFTDNFHNSLVNKTFGILVEWIYAAKKRLKRDLLALQNKRWVKSHYSNKASSKVAVFTWENNSLKAKKPF